MHSAIDTLERHFAFLETLGVIDKLAPLGPLRRSVLAEDMGAMFRALRVEQQVLPTSTPIYWSQATSQAVIAAAPIFNLAEIQCERDLVPCDRACCWFEYPVLSIDEEDGSTLPIRLLTWWFVSFADDGGDRQQGLSVTAWANNCHDSWLTPVVWSRFLEGEMLDHGLAQHPSAAKKCIAECLQFLVAAGTFMRQRLAAIDHQRPSRHARKRLAAKGRADAFIDVVRLRARDSAGRSPEIGARNYQWQWIVRSHMRQQFYPSLGKNLPILINPHIKGPADRPIRPRSKPLIVVDR
jgi:hypothetical protein